MGLLIFALKHKEGSETKKDMCSQNFVNIIKGFDRKLKNTGFIFDDHNLYQFVDKKFKNK